MTDPNVINFGVRADARGEFCGCALIPLTALPAVQFYVPVDCRECGQRGDVRSESGLPALGHDLFTKPLPVESCAIASHAPLM